MPKLGTRMLLGSDNSRLRGPLGTTSTPQASNLPFEIFFEVLGMELQIALAAPKAIARFSAKLVPKL